MSSYQEIKATVFDKRGRVLSIGQNSYVKTHPEQARLAKKCGLEHKVFLHAEVAAILKVRDLKKAHRILITRFGKNGEPLLAAPCPICASAIKAAGIKHIEHT